MVKIRLKFCEGKSCKNNFSSLSQERAEKEKSQRQLENVTIENCPCQGQCENGPIVAYCTEKSETLLSKMTPIRIGELFKKIDS